MALRQQQPCCWYDFGWIVVADDGDDGVGERCIDRMMTGKESACSKIAKRVVCMSACHHF